MSRDKPIIAVIPAHNAAATIRPLLNELIKQKYDGIYVLDDASTDDTVKIVKSYGDKVHLREHHENVGSGANRNRIIGLAPDSILHFIDADMQLVSKNTPGLIRRIKWNEDTAYIGGMVRNPDGSQNPFNYGPRASVVALFQSWFQYGIWWLGLRSQRLGRTLRSLFHPILHNWPDIYRAPRRKRTYWTAESNMIIRSETYEKLGGYDPIFRYSEIEDLALRLHRLGFKTYFEPAIDTIHEGMDNIYHRKAEKTVAFRYFMKKHGHLAFISPPLADHLARRHAKALEPSARRRRGTD